MNLLNKSINTLKKLQLKNGGILATPETGAYPYVYARDGTIITKALNKTRDYKSSEKFYYFLNKNSRIEKFKEVFHRYHAQGWPCVSNKHEHDGNALAVHGIYDTYKTGKNEAFLQTMWPFIIECMKFLTQKSKKGLVPTERSIHEFYRLEHGYEIWANSAACRAFQDAAEIAKIMQNNKQAKQWKQKAEQIKKNINKKLFNKKTGMYIKNTKYPKAPDISQLSPFYFEISNSEKILRKTMNYLRKNIWYDEIGGFRRFRKFEICKDWHWYTGGSGSWTVFTLWGARFYKQLNERKKSKECLAWVEKIAKKLGGQMPEHVAPIEEYELWKENEIEFNTRILNGMKKAKKHQIKMNNHLIPWATPLGWAHAEYVLFKK